MGYVYIKLHFSSYLGGLRQARNVLFVIREYTKKLNVYGDQMAVVCKLPSFAGIILAVSQYCCTLLAEK